MAKEMLKVEEAFWTFIDVEGLEPTNNFAYAASGISEIMPGPGLCRVGIGWTGRESAAVRPI
jgi:hypothetical protein